MIYAEEPPPAGGSCDKDSSVGSLRRLKLANLNDRPRELIVEEAAGTDWRPQLRELPPHVVQHLPACPPHQHQHASLHLETKCTLICGPALSAGYAQYDHAGVLTTCLGTIVEGTVARQWD